MPNVGYGNNKKGKHVLPNGYKKFLVRNEADLDAMLMHKNDYCAEIAHNLSSKKRKVILVKAEEMEIKVTNPNARVVTEEVE
ncbi:60S ribosomal protein L32 [Bonamia ostreae]|uniref:60S ribosomal protein L32 n=1 Tax=Bonamia ostreae TaxID=126728 RepID=A0ABV2AKT8_9EUKA